MATYSGIGGQAVIEGVMMKNKDHYAVAVRKPDGEIEIQKKKSTSLRDRYAVFNIPIIRGVVTFIESFTTGMGVLNYSASFYEEEEPKEMTEEQRRKAKRKDSILTALVTVVAVLAAIGIFVLGPFFASEALESWIPSAQWRGLIEGVIRVILFIIYVKLITLVPDIKRLFMYHGAEHKSINCVENGEDLTVCNVMIQSTEHRRCGTSFLLFVMVVSILFFMFIVVGSVWLRMLFRILLIPVIAGLSYELIRFLGSHEGKLVYVISRPGMWLQRLTTREPEEEMVEVAIASVNAVFDWRDFQGKDPVLTYEQALRDMTEELSEASVPEADLNAWYLMSEACRTEASDWPLTRAQYQMRRDHEFPKEAAERYKTLVEQRKKRIPLEYITHRTEFMGVPFYVDERVLIPRQDTETLVEEALLYSQGADVLDLCTGSGCIAVSLALSGGCRSVTATDCSEEALEVAAKNVAERGAQVDLYPGDLWEAVRGRESARYDLITCNPPYIRQDVIPTLMPEVKDHEPVTALLGGEDGLIFYRRIMDGAGVFLKTNGHLIVEIGYDQAEAVSEMMREAGFKDVSVKKDLAGHDRIVTGLWTEE